jgi:hypothetical protein
VSPVVAYRETVKVIADLLESEMDLAKDIVAVYNSARRIPPKKGFFIDVAILGEAPFAANARPVNDPAEPEVVAVQTIAQREILQVDIFSADDSARLRRIDMIFALTGIAAQQACERHAMKISNLPQSFIDLSQVEASTRLNRYALTVTVIRSYSKAKTVPSFAVFQVPPRAIIVNR